MPGSTAAALDSVRQAPSLLEGMRRAVDLGEAASTDDDGARAAALLAAAAADTSDHLTAIAAVHALGRVDHPAAAVVLTDLLARGLPATRPGEHVPTGPEGAFTAALAEHAAWALGGRPRHDPAMPHLQRMAAAGAFTGMLAERTLAAWGEEAGTSGQALTPLGTQRPGRAPSSAPPSSSATRPPEQPALTVAQVYLHADLDRDLSHAGQGDAGGIATLLAHLGDALLADGRVQRVLTISRGGPDTPEPSPARLAGPGHHFPHVPLPGRPVPAADAWPRWAAARAGIAAVLRAAGHVDVLHLRMADVGSMVAADVAHDLRIPVVFTAAPDPHALIAAREAAGTLIRATFAPADLAEHLWFRHHLVARLVTQAAHVVLFPRPDVARDARDLLGLDVAAHPERYSVVGEGIDLGPIDRALASVGLTAAPRAPNPPEEQAEQAERPDPATARALADLDALLRTLPPGRRSLPLAVTVGRVHRVKGTATLVAAWAGDSALRERCTLLVVGGDLEHPTAEESEQLTRIDAAVPRNDGPSRGLLLAGHRANSAIPAWLAATRAGRPGLAAPGGAYVCASLKEEFGLAILEAMACGLVAVAPDAGGPPTYVDDGATGVLADTSDPAALARAINRALDLAAAPDALVRADRARAVVRERFSIGAMATALADVYERLASPDRATAAPATLAFPPAAAPRPSPEGAPS